MDSSRESTCWSDVRTTFEEICRSKTMPERRETKSRHSLSVRLKERCPKYLVRWADMLSLSLGNDIRVKFVEDVTERSVNFQIYIHLHMSKKDTPLYLLSCTTVLKRSFELTGSSTCKSSKRRIQYTGWRGQEIRPATQRLNADSYQWKRRPKYWHLVPSNSSLNELWKVLPEKYDCVKIIGETSKATRFICFLCLYLIDLISCNHIMLLWMSGGKAMYISVNDNFKYCRCKILRK